MVYAVRMSGFALERRRSAKLPPTETFPKGPQSQAHAGTSDTRASGSVPSGLNGCQSCLVRLLPNYSIETPRYGCAAEDEGYAHIVMVYAVIRDA